MIYADSPQGLMDERNDLRRALANRDATIATLTSDLAIERGRVGGLKEEWHAMVAEYAECRARLTAAEGDAGRMRERLAQAWAFNAGGVFADRSDIQVRKAGPAGTYWFVVRAASSSLDGAVLQKDGTWGGRDKKPFADYESAFAALSPPTGHAPDGIALVTAERRAQVTREGWTPEHDDEHDDEQLAIAGAIYAMPGCSQRAMLLRTAWPWASEWWKPTPHDRVRELVKAGALIVAEIDRLLRSGSASDAPTRHATGEPKKEGQL